MHRQKKVLGAYAAIKAQIIIISGDDLYKLLAFYQILYHITLCDVRGMFEMNCLLSSSSISTWGTIKTNTYLYRAIQYLHNGV